MGLGFNKHYIYCVCYSNFCLQPKEFFAGHIAGSLSFSLGGAGGTVVGPEDGNFAIWVSSHSAVRSDVEHTAL